MERLALFDVDFTITKKETLMQLYIYTLKEDKKNIKYLPRALFSGLMYLLKIYDEKRVKESFLKFLDNMDENEIRKLTNGFYRKSLKGIIYKDGLKMIKKLKKEGYKVYLISASPEFYLNELYDIKEVDKIIGTRFSFENGRFTRKMYGANCKGQEKVKRLKEVIEREHMKVDFKNSYMFSDSLSDKPLLDLVGNPYLINYKGKSKYKILNWK